MNPDKICVCQSVDNSPFRDNKVRKPLAPLYHCNGQHNCACRSPLAFTAPHLSIVKDHQASVSPATPKRSPSSASLPARYTPVRATSSALCYSDKSYVNNYSSTPVKRCEKLDTRHYLTPLSSKACLPGTINRKGVGPCLPQKPRVYNPFDRCPEQFGFPTVSPSLFKEVVSPSKTDDSTFSWAIDNIAILHPASIENSPYSQADLPTDPEYEAKAQEHIDKFFSEAVLSSPWTDSPVRPLNLLSILSGNERFPVSIGSSPVLGRSSNVMCKLGLPQLPVEKAKCRNSWTQSEITLPPILPKEVEDALAPFCTFTTDQMVQEEEETTILNATSLRRKLQFSKEDLCSATLRQNFTRDSDECNSMARSISPIPLDDFDDDVLPWDTSMVPGRSAFRQCNFCSDAKLSNCVHVTPHKMRSSLNGNAIMSPNLSSISWDSPKDSGTEAPALLLPPPNVSPIEKWSKKTRKRNYSEEILSSATAGGEPGDGNAAHSGRTDRNLPLMLHIGSSPIKMDTESQFSSSLLSLSDPPGCAKISDFNISSKMSDSLTISPISIKKSSSMPSDRTFVTFINEETANVKCHQTIGDNSASNQVVQVKKEETASIDSTLATMDGCSVKVNNDFETISTDSRSMFMDVDSQRFENIFSNENNHSQDTGYQTGSFFPSYCSGNEKNESVEKELLKAKVNEKFPNIFSSFNFNCES